MVLETDRLPSIVSEFLRYSDTLRNLIQKATWEIMEDIKLMLYDYESKDPLTYSWEASSHTLLVARWLGSDQMSHQYQYHDELRTVRADQACKYLLETSSFVNWYDAIDNSQQLVLVGDMGCGKTVAMSFLVDILKIRNQGRLPEPKLCYYYCRDDKTGKGTSILSALILSLLEQLPGLKKPFFEWYKQAQAAGTFDLAASITELGEYLERLLEMIDRPIYFVIDGLDECDRASRGRLLRPGLKILLSTRPEQAILQQLGEAAWIELDPDAERDAIVADKMIENQLSYLSPNVKVLVRDQLSRLAQGSAIWTKMIVELIEVRKISAIDPMRRFMQDIPLPKQLTSLYATLFSRSTSDDPENQQLASTALKLLAVTHRPFSILELAWAVTLDFTPVTTVNDLACLVDHQRIMSLIHPFIARVDLKDVRARQVRLVHQSVKEFVLENSDLPLTQGGPVRKPSQMVTEQRLEDLNAFIFDICIRYLLLDEIGQRSLFSEEQMAIAELPQDDDLFDENKEPVQYDRYCTWESWEENMIHYDPTERGFGEFFVYASCHWLEYFGSITANCLPRLESIEDLCRAGSTRLQNWIQQNCRPDCAISPRFEFESSLYDPLSITCLYGSEAMLRVMLEKSDFDNERFLRNPAMGAADQILRWGDITRLRILFLDETLGHELQNVGFFRLVIIRWSDCIISQQDWTPVFSLIDYMPEGSVQGEWRNEILTLAANYRCTPMIQRMETPQLSADS
ncbi:NACHT domain protein [Aspergillus novofumigatus IBT 16806]|uniref:NACHT domain protein n=1 Tax=Aspergillus novofumigatus (strain IBT 16806) TaxID=1392255 RepID=A0A2I1BUW5_ASPN1|nr:NACHT domain protein [Aspergillus novofumigatus IBT 16806]PKX89144.1 NACHT domain protein [Aspergillus novofumigatus IBT 16806]